MKRILYLFAGCFLAITATAKDTARPKLVVGIVVDQMRWDYLYRYEHHFGPGGFKRLMHEGFRCEQTFLNYLPSFTAPGHTCIYTGSVPAIHGIAGNDWFENGKSVYCTDDKTVMPVGGSMKWGQMSPRNLLTSTVTDELRLATNLRSRVFGVSLKDRSSILPAGHLANGAFWFDDSTGTFTTSTYYRNKLPSWLREFNSQHPADALLSYDWILMDPASTYTQSTADTNRYEGRFSKLEPGTGFPHLAKYFTGTGVSKYNTLRKLPAGNWLTLQLAKACITANELGDRPDPDFLCVSLSSTDYAGHQFGPNSMELEDMYVRLDHDLEQFLKFLDRTVGEGEYTVFLTADHGAAHNFLFLEDLKVPAGNVSESGMLQQLNSYLKAQLHVENLVLGMENYQVYFRGEQTISGADHNGILEQAKQLTVKWLKTRPEVEEVINMEAEGAASFVPEPIKTMLSNGYYAPRSGTIQIILKPGYYSGYGPTGTTHGTWNPYDTHIPLIWYGWGIPEGETHREVHMTDIAATLSALLHIQMPNGCVGKVITEIMP